MIHDPLNKESPNMSSLLRCLISPTMASTTTTILNILFFFFFFFSFLIHSTTLSLSASTPPLLPPQALPTSSGYLPLNSSAIFYAFYEAQRPLSPLSAAPLLVWLQGGPGCSSMIANFFELGPWLLAPTPRPNPFSWNRLFGLLFLDSPIGTGFSLAASPSDIPTGQDRVARDLFAALAAFMDRNPAFEPRPVFITGESYAGKYIPAIARYIARKGAPLVVNLKGVAIGNGLTDPVVQVGTHAEAAYLSGMVNGRQRRELERLQEEAVELARAGRWGEASRARSGVLDRLQEMTGLATLYDITRREPYRSEVVEEVLRDEGVKAVLGAAESVVFERCSKAVRRAMDEDMMKGVKHMVDYLLGKTQIKVLLYQGQLDVRMGVVSNEAWVRTLRWEGIDGFLEAERKVWRLEGGELAGYVQRWGSLSNVVVLGAGHMAPADQPASTQAMIEDWVLDRGLFGVGHSTDLETE